MNDLKIRDLLHEVADDIEPADRLDAIRAATAPAGRRTRRGWWVVGGAGLVAASVVTALAVTTGSPTKTKEPEPIGPASTSGPVATDGAETDEADTAMGVTVETGFVYFVGNTTAGPRLYGEPRFDVDPDSRVVVGIDAALRGDARDPDYRSPWPDGVVLREWQPGPDVLTIILDGAPVDRPAGMSEEDARLALEQLVRTAQATYGQGAIPVDVQVERRVTDTVLGVPTTAPLTGSPDRDVLAPVSLSEPSEGQTVRVDRTVWASGRATSVDNSVTVRLQRLESAAVVMGPATSTLDQANGSPGSFSIGYRSDDLRPGEYEVIATVRNPDGTTDTDTRRITIVD
nr:hypothetical protein [uncultured Nocardioides sp.]